jgi:predicted Zn-ribbon and HTH transcriptional regulator
VTEREKMRLAMAVTIAAAVAGEGKPVPIIERLLEKYEAQIGAEDNPVTCTECGWEGDARELADEGHCPRGCHAAAVVSVIGTGEKG